MASWYSALRPLLFRLDPERAHRLAFSFLVTLEQAVRRRDRPLRPWTHPTLQQELWRTIFANPIGLAAGFDKDAEMNRAKKAMPAALRDAFANSDVEINVVGYKLADAEEVEAREQFKVIEELPRPVPNS